jgi:hypothetical protein
MDEASFKKCLSADDSVRGIRAALRSPGLRPHVIRQLERYERPGENPAVGAGRLEVGREYSERVGLVNISSGAGKFRGTGTN